MSQSVDTVPAESPANRWLVLTIVLCVLVTAASLWVGRNRDRIRSSDEAAYAEQAQSLLDDGTLTVGFVRHFHVKYPADVLHPEDFYPPGPGALIAASWVLLGRSDYASSVPSILLTGLLLPLLAFGLARRLGASPPFAFGCAMTVLFEPLLRFHAFQGLADVPFTACMAGAVLVALGSGRRSAIVAGALLGLGFWFKPTAFLFVPGLLLAVMVTGARDRRDALWRAVLVLVAFAAVCAPWLARNAILFGDPLYSGNKLLTAEANRPDFTYYDLRKVYWGADLAEPVETAIGVGVEHWLLRWATNVFQIVVDHGASAFGLSFAMAALLVWRRRPVAAVLLVITTFAVGLAAVFGIFLRYLMPIFPLVAAVSWTGGATLAERLRGGDLGRIFAHPARLALVLAALVSLQGGLQLVRDLALGKGDYAQGVDGPHRRSAEWSKEHLPADSRIMSQEALRFRHSSGMLSINTPWDQPDAIERVVEHYRVTHLVMNPSGDFSAISNRFLLPYLDQYGARWKEIVNVPGEYVVWRRK
jgi:4-amino-4-deoxy-L-arabinose transferase-like glycosyltransferase